MNKKILLIIVLILAAGLFFFGRNKHVEPVTNIIPLLPSPDPVPTISVSPTVIVHRLSPTPVPVQKKSPLPEPAPSEVPPAPTPQPTAPLTAEQQQRAEGRRQRKRFPVGVILNDGVGVYDRATDGKVLYRLQTGDVVRVLNQGEAGEKAHIHPGMDIFLAATSKDVEAAGENLPDMPGWMDKKDLFVFDPGRAKEFLEGTEPMTIGDDPSFSTLSFYERAMKNPDPVVHRVIGPRLISILDIHEDYSASWGAIYRDNDSKIRALALASLRQRGVGNSRPIIEDLITRLSELTEIRAEGEREAEVLMILDILKASGHPRVRAALQGFADTWKTTQSDRVNDSLRDILSH